MLDGVEGFDSLSDELYESLVHSAMLWHSTGKGNAQQKVYNKSTTRLEFGYYVTATAAT